ncbi:MAG: hypothetical protein ABI390_09525 [Daejeonella sp.]
MKTILKYSTLLLMAIVISSCAKKISNPTIDKLEVRKDLLKKSTELNGLKLELEKEIVRNTRLISDVEDINKQASASADDAKDLSNRLSRNPGDQSLSRRADKASKQAARDAKKAHNLNDDLDKSTNQIADLQRKIKRLAPEVEDLQSKSDGMENNISN